MSVLENVRSAVRGMQGYTPGEQPKDRMYVKLNTNENPYPPSDLVMTTLKECGDLFLNRYPDPIFRKLRETAARVYEMPSIDWVIAGNGSDDLLTIALRTFVDQHGLIACPDITYSLYGVLADLQGANIREIPLTEEFDLPKNLAEQCEGATLFFLTRPNAPTGKTYPLEVVRQFCREFKGIVWIDEAYADFAQDSCLALVKEFDNVVVSRTFSKSFSLAGIRLGLAFASPILIAEMYKVKDSYNVNMLTQQLGIAALESIESMQQKSQMIQQTRAHVIKVLRENEVEFIDSSANFILMKPKWMSAEKMFALLKSEGILVRWFNQERIRDYLRVSIGTDEDMEKFLSVFLRKA